MRTPLRVAAAALTALLVTGCSDDPAPKPAPPPSATTSSSDSGSPSPKPSTSPTSNPSLSIAPAGETAQDFIKRWVALGNQMQATGAPEDIDAYLAVAGPDCDSCHEFASTMERIYTNGGYVRGGVETLTGSEAESETQWVISVTSTPSEFIESKGGAIDHFAGGSYRTRLFLGKVAGRWTVGSTEVLP